MALELPMYFVVNRVAVSSLFCLALLLRRLVWSTRLCDLSIEFGYDDTTTSQHFNYLLLLLVTKYSRLLICGRRYLAAHRRLRASGATTQPSHPLHPVLLHGA